MESPDIEYEARCSTGCVATALAQIMYYHKWPEQGRGSHSYDWEWHDQTITADFGATTYQWDKMKDTYSCDDDDPDDAVATLMYHCGVALDTHYYIDGSAVKLDGFEEKMIQALCNYFNYFYSPTEAQVDKIGTAAIENILYDELSAQRPVLVVGGSDTYHAFICDGYEEGYFHFNYGWGGDYDNYFLLSAIKPFSNYDFSPNVRIIYGIQKPENENRFEIDNVLYELYPEGTALLVHGDPEGEYEIPSLIQLNGQSYKVTAIGDRAYTHCKNVTSVIIPNSVTSIGNAAFKECSINSVTIPNSVTSIGGAAFAGSPLYSITIPESITSIDYDVFRDCWLLDNVTIPNSVTSIGNNAFNGCYNMWSVTIPNSVTTIGDGAFGGTSLTTLTIPNSVTYIGDGAFGGINQDRGGLGSIQVEKGNPVYDSREDCNAIIETANNKLIFGCKKSFIPNSVTSIGDGAFGYCLGLTSMTIPDGVTSIGNGAFCQCENLTSINIPDGVEAIGDWTFTWCPLTSITIPESVTTIGEYSFWGCEKLTSVTIPNSVISIGDFAFTYCYGLTSVVLSNSLTKLSGALFDGCGLTSVTIPDGVTFIDDMAFSSCSRLTSIHIPNSVTTIGSWAFNCCPNLTSVTIPNSVTFIDVQAFEECGLTSIVIPNSITSISAYTFLNCTNLTSVTIPSNVTSIGASAFWNCTSLKDVYCAGDVPNMAHFNAFTDVNLENVTLHVPADHIEAYKSAEYWRDFGHIVVDPFVITAKDYSRFYGEANPTLECYVRGGEMTGIPEITCEATETSPVGTYEIVMKQGTIEEPDASLANGMLTIEPAPLTISTGTYTIKQGDPMPEFTLTYDGFMNGEMADVLTTQPIITCEASETCEPGEYPIIISGAEAQNYAICYVAGKVIVIERPSHTLTYMVDGMPYKTLSIREDDTITPEPMPTKEGYVFLGWSEIPETMPNSDVEVTGAFYLYGDVNIDSEVDLLDVVDIARFVVGTPAGSFMEVLADLNQDNNVNVTDAVVLVNEIAGDQSFAMGMRMNALNDGYDYGSCCLELQSSEGRTLSLHLNGEADFTAFQFIMDVPENDDVSAILLNSVRKNGHQLLYNKMENGCYRVVVLSLTNNRFIGNEGELLSIGFNGQISDDICLRDILFVTSDGIGVSFKNLHLNGTSTHIEEQLNRTVDNNQVYDLQGRHHSSTKRGINVVNGKKVVIK